MKTAARLEPGNSQSYEHTPIILHEINALDIDFKEAERFLTTLDESAERFTFQSFDDNKNRKDPSLTRIFNGSFDEVKDDLAELNRQGAGIFVTVNETDLTGRKAENITRPRALWIEDDNGGAPNPSGLDPHIIVQSSHGQKQHKYFLLDNSVAIDPKEWGNVEERLVLEYGSDPNAKDLARVLRLPGFYHQKDPSNPFRVKIIHESGERPHDWEHVKKYIPPVTRKETERPAAPGDGSKLPEMRSALSAVDPDCDYMQWLAVGMAIHHETGGGHAGLEAWDNWSAGGTKYPANPDALTYKWNSFSSNTAKPVTAASIFKMAQAQGWLNPKTRLQAPESGQNDEATTLRFSDADTLADNAKAADFLINGIIESDAHGICYGPSMTFKTFFVLSLAHSAATGSDFFGHKVFKTGLVLYVCGEGKGALARRIKALSLVNGGFGGNLKILETLMSIDNRAEMQLLRDSIIELKPIIVIFDTFSSLSASTDENSNTEVSATLRLMRDTCSAAGSSSIVVAHTGKSDQSTIRGAEAFRANVDFSIKLERGKNSMITTVSSEKTKDGEPFSTFSLKAESVDLGFKNQDGTAATSLILKPADDSTGKPTRIKLSQRDGAIFQTLHDAIAKSGIAPNSDIRLKFGGFDTLSGQHRKVVLIDDWRTFAYPAILVDGGTDAAKQKAFKRCRDRLVNQGFIVEFDDYAWPIFSE